VFSSGQAVFHVNVNLTHCWTFVDFEKPQLKLGIAYEKAGDFMIYTSCLWKVRSELRGKMIQVSHELKSWNQYFVSELPLGSLVSLSVCTVGTVVVPAHWA